MAPTEPKPKRAKNRTAIDPNWQPSERDENYAVTRIADIPATAERFRNFHAAKGSLMADWSAAWRTWVGNEPRFAPRQDAGRNGWAVMAEGMMRDREAEAFKADLEQFDHPKLALN